MIMKIFGEYIVNFYKINPFFVFTKKNILLFFRNKKKFLSYNVVTVITKKIIF